MIKKAVYFMFLLLCCIYLSLAQAEEKITLSTYYPAPYAEYDQLAANSMVVGRTYPFPADDNLIVEGSVGIGETTPGAKLDVETTGTADYPLLIRSDIDNNGGYTGIQFGWDGNPGNYKKAAIMVRGTSGSVQPEMHFLLDNTVDSSNADINDAVLTLDNGGNVGIGTTIPGSLLHIRKTGDVSSTVGSAPGSLRIEGTGSYNWAAGEAASEIDFMKDADIVAAIRAEHDRTGGDHTYEDAGISFYTGSAAEAPSLTRRMHIASGTYSGYVGIGTTTPGKTLDVIGDIRASSNVYLSANDFHRMTAWMNCVAAGRIAGMTIALITWPNDGRTTTCDALCTTAVGPNSTTAYTCIGGGYFGYSPTQNTSSQGSFGERLNWGACSTSFGPAATYGYSSSMGLYMTDKSGTGSGHVCCCGK